MTGLLIAFCAALGLIIGSFLNVVIWRLPRRESVVHPGSQCPGCHADIAAYDNVPVVSWIVLRGRCRRCATAISLRYPAVELLTAVLFAVLGWRFGFDPALPAYLYLAAVGVALALIDLDVHRLPDVLTLPSYPVGIIALTAASWVSGDWWALARAGIGMVALWAFYQISRLIKPNGMGRGDVKLSGVLGLFLAYVSWGALAVGAFAGFLIGGVVGIALIAATSAGRKTRLPYGPWMIAGALLGVLVGDQIARAYWNFALRW